MILVVHGHPYPTRSRACAALLDSIRDLPLLEVRRLYEMYPDFDVDAAAEQEALARASRVVWMAPLYWYSVPGLVKHWFDVVLTEEFAFGERASCLAGKRCLWVATTGGEAYAPEGRHRHPFGDFVAPLEMTARFCGMQWEAPFVVHDAGRMPAEALRERGERLRERLAP